MTEARKLRLELQAAQTRIGVLCAERDAYLRQRDEAIGEGNELLRQRDEAIGLKNLQAERSARLAHRADLKSSRKPRVATRDRILMFPHLAQTGGRTLADIVLRNFSPGEVLTIHTSEVDGSSVGSWSRQAVEKALRRMQKSELDEAARCVGRLLLPRHSAASPKPCDCVTLLRDPSERRMSNGCLDGALVKAAASSGNDLDRHQRRPPHLDNHMTRILSGVFASIQLDSTGPRKTSLP